MEKYGRVNFIHLDKIKAELKLQKIEKLIIFLNRIKFYKEMR